MSTQNQHTRDLAWLSSFPEDKRFRLITIVIMLLTLISFVIVPMINVPPLERRANTELPQRYAKLILDKKLKKEEPKKKELTEAEKEALRKAEEERRKKLEEERQKREEELKKQREEDKKKAEEERKKLEEQKKKELEEQRKRAEDQKKLDAEKLKQDAEKQKQDAEKQRLAAEKQRAEAERQRAEEERRRVEAEKQRVAAEKKKGEELAASMFGDLAQLSTEAPAATTTAPTKLVSANKEPAPQAAATNPNLLTSKSSSTSTGSGGIDTSKLAQVSTGTPGGGAALEQRKTTVVKDVDLGVLDGSAAASDSKTNAKGEPTRSARDINVKLEANKGRLNKIYQRALRDDPTLGGKVVLKITISPDGKVTNVVVASSEIQVDDFLNKLITAIKGIDFGAEGNVGNVTVTYPIDFGSL